GRLVVGNTEIGLALDSYIVVIKQTDQLSEAEMPGDGCCLVGNALHKIPVAAKTIRIVIDYLVLIRVEKSGEMLFGHRHSHRVAKALTEGPGRGLYPGGMPVFRMAGGFTSPLSEIFDFFEGKIIARQVKNAVLQHGSVPAGEYKPVPIDPIRIAWIVVHYILVQHVRCRGQRHRRTGVT